MLVGLCNITATQASEATIVTNTQQQHEEKVTDIAPEAVAKPAKKSSKRKRSADDTFLTSEDPKWSSPIAVNFVCSDKDLSNIKANILKSVEVDASTPTTLSPGRTIKSR